MPRSLYLTYATVAVAFLTVFATSRKQNGFSPESPGVTQNPRKLLPKRFNHLCRYYYCLFNILRFSDDIFAGTYYVYRINSDVRCIRAERQVSCSEIFKYISVRNGLGRCHVRSSWTWAGYTAQSFNAAFRFISFSLFFSEHVCQILF